MTDVPDFALVNDFLGSAHVFALAVNQVIEDELWRDAGGNQFTVKQMRLLKLVDHPGGVHTIGDVAAFLGISNAAASKGVDKLVRLMLIRRREGESDRRAIQLSLTGPGRRILEAYDKAVRDKLAQVFGPFEAAELQLLVQVMDRLSTSIMNGRAVANGEICVRCGVYFRDTCLLRQLPGLKCLHLRRSRCSTAAPAVTADDEKS